MSRDLTSDERPSFVKHYGTGDKCVACGNREVIVRIWENYASPAKNPGGDIGPKNIVAAVVLCEQCGHGQTVTREEILQGSSAPASA
jgi:hypothetical protein